MQDHTFRLTKCSHPSLRQCMPNNEPVKIEHGQMLAKWCAAPGASQAAGLPANGRGKLLSELRDITAAIHGWKKGMKPAEWTAAKQKLSQYLWDEGILADTQFLDELAEDELIRTIDAVKTKIGDVPH